MQKVWRLLQPFPSTAEKKYERWHNRIFSLQGKIQKVVQNSCFFKNLSLNHCTTFQMTGSYTRIIGSSAIDFTKGGTKLRHLCATFAPPLANQKYEFLSKKIAREKFLYHLSSLKSIQSTLEASLWGFMFPERWCKVAQSTGERWRNSMNHLCTDLEVLSWQC